MAADSSAMLAARVIVRKAQNESTATAESLTGIIDLTDRPTRAGGPIAIRFVDDRTTTENRCDNGIRTTLRHRRIAQLRLGSVSGPRRIAANIAKLPGRWEAAPAGQLSQWHRLYGCGENDARAWRGLAGRFYCSALSIISSAMSHGC
jgi:hypothetical protein